eukprot:403375496
MRELFETDLKGKLYGFVPHCKLLDTYFISGYWKKLLKDRGLDYYFGGLFLADIAKFREEYGYSEYLRRSYQRFTQDEINENLVLMDQDLINYAQINIPIHRLSTKWLWCEAWCDKEDEEQAMIIDFCTDPYMLKESKFERAKRIIHDYQEQYEDIIYLLS